MARSLKQIFAAFFLPVIPCLYINITDAAHFYGSRTVRANPVDPAEAIQTLESLWYKQLKISPELTFIKRPYIVNDRLELKTAVDHPCPESEIAYLDLVELASLLNKIIADDTFGDLMYRWETTPP